MSDRSRKVAIIAHSAGLAMAAALAAAGGHILEERESGYSRELLERYRRQEKQDRIDRRRRADEQRERLLRQRIAEGRDDRADKYLHRAARERRAAQAVTHPDREGKGGER